MLNYAILCKIGLNRDYISTVIVHFVKLEKITATCAVLPQKQVQKNEMQYCMNNNFA